MGLLLNVAETALLELINTGRQRMRAPARSEYTESATSDRASVVSDGATQKSEWSGGSVRSRYEFGGGIRERMTPIWTTGQC